MLSFLVVSITLTYGTELNVLYESMRTMPQQHLINAIKFNGVPELLLFANI